MGCPPRLWAGSDEKWPTASAGVGLSTLMAAQMCVGLSPSGSGAAIPFLSLTRNILLLLLVVSTGSLAAQDQDFRWGRIAAEDLAMTTYEADTTASAIVLSDVADLRFNVINGDIFYDFIRHKRLKILKRSGFEEADIAIPYYGDEKLSSLKAQLILPNGERTSVEREDFFEETYNNGYVKVKKFTFPNLQEGAVLEYQYQIKSPYLFELREWYFQSDIPIRWSEYRLAIPIWYDYIVITQGPPYHIQEKEDGSMNANLPVTHLRYVMKDMPALKRESYITTMDDYLSRIRFQLHTVTYPGQLRESIMGTWAQAATKLTESLQFGQQYIRNANCKNIKALVPALIAGASTKAEQANRIYTFLNRTMKWNEEFGIFVDTDLDECFERKTGSGAELNLMLVAMLQEAGIKAYPLLTSTRDHGKMFDLYPMLDQFNHVMVLAELDDAKLEVFDVGNIFRPAGLPRMSALNGEGWALIPDSPQWIDLRAKEGYTQEVFKGRLDEEGNLTGSWRAKYDGYSAVLAREDLHSDSAEAYIRQQLETVSPDIIISNIGIQDQDTLTKPVILTADCTLNGVAQVNAEFMYLSPVINPPFTESPFKLEKRTYPVNIPYPSVSHHILQLQLPDGYQVAELPEKITLALPDRGMQLAFSAGAMGNMLTVTYKLEIKQLIYTPEQYEALREFFNICTQKLGEQIVLKRS